MLRTKSESHGSKKLKRPTDGIVWEPNPNAWRHLRNAREKPQRSQSIAVVKFISMLSEWTSLCKF